MYIVYNCELKTIIIHIYNKVRSCFHSNVYCIQYTFNSQLRTLL